MLIDPNSWLAIILSRSNGSLRTEAVKAAPVQFTVHWVLWIRAGSPDKARKVLSRFSSAVGLKIIESRLDRDREGPGRYRMMCSSSLDAHRVEDAVFETIRRSQRAAAGWQIGSIQRHEPNQWEFDGLVNSRIRIPGLVAIQFWMVNFENSESQVISTDVEKPTPE
jgi:hypothetical protein